MRPPLARRRLVIGGGSAAVLARRLGTRCTVVPRRAYQAAFLIGIVPNLLNMSIAFSLLLGRLWPRLSAPYDSGPAENLPGPL
jgi:hypothetical protein